MEVEEPANKLTSQVDIQEQISNISSPKSVKFEQEWVQVLINLRMKHAKLFTRRRNSATDGWKLVYEELIASGAPSFITIAKIKKKWMNLMTRFRQIKHSAMSPDKVTWPYFEQINAALGKELEFLEDRKHDSSFRNDCRLQFITSLIKLRYGHKHLFTGKKYTARDGWIIIRSMLKCDDKYTVEQLSKCWQNLVQRYKQLSRSQAPITWPYYDLMDKWHNEENLNDNVKLEIDSMSNIIEGEDGELFVEQEPSQSLEIIKNYPLEEILLQLNKIREIQERNQKDMLCKLNFLEDLLKQQINVPNIQ